METKEGGNVGRRRAERPEETRRGRGCLAVTPGRAPEKEGGEEEERGIRTVMTRGLVGGTDPGLPRISSSCQRLQELPALVHQALLALVDLPAEGPAQKLAHGLPRAL
jgi:hypothetical protein